MCFLHLLQSVKHEGTLPLATHAGIGTYPALVPPTVDLAHGIEMFSLSFAKTFLADDDSGICIQWLPNNISLTIGV
jgi:hypothetical protein